MLSLSALLCEPNPDDPLVREIAMQWRKSRPEHDRKAAQLTKEYVLRTCLARTVLILLTFATCLDKLVVQQILQSGNA